MDASTSSCIDLPSTGSQSWFKWLTWNSLLLCGLSAAILLAFSIGKYPTSLLTIMQFFLHWIGFNVMDNAQFDTLHNVLIDIRLPRILVAMLVGSTLSVSGAAFQAVFRNPLVSPGLLGVQSGAAFGAALGILLGCSWAVIQGLAFSMGLIAVFASVLIANVFGQSSMVMLVLGGMISSALFSSLVSVIKYVADPLNVLPSIVYWLMGNLALADLPQVLTFGGPLIVGIVLIAGCGRMLDALSMGDDEAQSLGIPVAWVRYSIIAITTMISALTVSIAGTIGWVGLLIPHIVRMMLGPANSRVLPASIILGATFLILADCISRCIADSEIPIGIVTEILGIPVFLLVLKRSRKGWN
ncbi:iron ABC transporter permease [uncultured Tolumonas sp.]|uniref:FecCD family ABC transporter permease n=1 Tax=uncultured Tolumonas sp. TaxID=263765 RepID=UPI00293182AB|nr:iron ABC transporter permease [uncultured Tolumonas sp.]